MQYDMGDPPPFEKTNIDPNTPDGYRQWDDVDAQERLDALRAIIAHSPTRAADVEWLRESLLWDNISASANQIHGALNEL